jgi:DNA-binding NarL/FixJ family response regulator
MSHPEKLIDTPPSVDEAPPKRKILIDDGDSVQDGIRLFMEHEGFEVDREPANGLQAIEQANKFDKTAGLDKLLECVRSLLAQPGREVLRQRV